MRRERRKRFITLLSIFVLIAAAVQAFYVPPLEASAATAVLVGAGDIASCDYDSDEETAKLLDGISGTVFTTGDLAYMNGKYSQFTECYHPTWGRHKDRTRPVPGNHEYNTANAYGYFTYFSNTYSYYAYNLGGWRIYALNSEIDVSLTSPQLKWLKSDLEAHPKLCVLAYWHRPRWSSGRRHGSDPKYHDLWKMLHDAGAELVINGHEHHYERFAQMDATGAKVAQGLREIVVGTGGAPLYSFGSLHPASKVRNADTYGVLKLSLNADSYTWRFVPVAGETFKDGGTTSCH